MQRPGRFCVVIAASSFLVHCGSRTGFEDYEGTPVHDGGSPGDTSPPEDGPPDASSVEASSCTPAPAGGIAIASLSIDVISIGLTAVGGTVYAGLAAIGDNGPLYVGSIDDVPSGGGTPQPLVAPEFNFGSVASDGARLYYPQSSGKPQGPNGAIYTVLGLASIDLATGAAHAITPPAPPRSTSSNLNSYMIAATSAWPGVYWVGAPAGANGAGTVSAWDPKSDTVTTIATGEDLSGLAVDASGVYWADVGGNQGITVYRSPLGGGEPFALAKIPGGTHGQLLGVSSSDVVFVTDYASGVIEAVSKTGGPVRPLVTAMSAWVNAFAWVDDSDLYWTESQDPATLKRIPAAGGSVQVVPTTGQIQSLAFDTCNIYIGSLGPTQVVAQPRM
jgi:hypothetical protein